MESGLGGFVFAMPPFRLARLAVACTLGLASPVLGGCSMFGGGDSKPETTAATTPAAARAPDEIDVRRYIGPDYCPELRVLNGAELLRRYEKGHDEDPAAIIWQASVGRTARECLFDLQGGMTLKIGVSGRVIAGPKGGAGTVSVPLKIAVVKYREAVLATEDLSFDVAIPPSGSTAFTQVKEILVPSPGKDRDYIIYVGFDVGEWDPLHGEAAKIAVVEEPPPPPVDPAPAAPKPPKTPNVLPTPTDGFVLPR
jgi:hypothetical protein